MDSFHNEALIETAPQGTPASDKRTELADLVVNGFRELYEGYRKGQPYYKASVGVRSLLLLIPLVLGLGCSAILFLIVHWMVDWIGSEQNWAYYVIGILVCLFPVVLAIHSKLVQYGGLVDALTLTSCMPNKPPMRRIKFFRLQIALGSMSNCMSFFLGMTLGTQTALMHYTSGHARVAFETDWWGYLWLSFDNLFHGVMLYLGELYDLRLAHRIDHSRWSATLFLTFRLLYDALIIVLFTGLWQQLKVRHLMANVDKLLADPSAGNLSDYLCKNCYGRQKWRKSYHEEFVFLCIVQKYLDGKYDDCLLLAELFSEVEIPAEVRALFVDENGKSLFDYNVHSFRAEMMELHDQLQHDHEILTKLQEDLSGKL